MIGAFITRRFNFNTLKHYWPILAQRNTNLVVFLWKKTTELVLFFHKKTTNLVFVWPNMSQKIFKVLSLIKNIIIYFNFVNLKLSAWFETGSKNIYFVICFLLKLKPKFTITPTVCLSLPVFITMQIMSISADGSDTNILHYFLHS